MFSGLEISRAKDFEKHLNQYDVLHWDIQWCMEPAGGPERIVSYISEKTISELKEYYPHILPEEIRSLPEALSRINAASGTKFIVIIDEWDVLIRDEAADLKTQEEYINFLRAMFKGTEPTKYIQLAYLTGILPVKKEKTQSALNNFKDYSMLHAGPIAPYVGFTEQEVKDLCSEYQIDFSKMKLWYDGYSFPNANSIYNPNSVMKALRNDDFDSYWTQTSAAESLMEYISLDYDGLSKTIAELIGGIEVGVDTSGFSNDLVTFREKDDVLTLLIHLGYLAYDKETEKVHIPNEEIKREFSRTIRGVRRNETIQRVRESDQIISDTVHMNADAVAAQIEKIHTEETTALFYNNEQALRSVIKLAYFSYRDYYLKFEELPSGNGYADIVYFPKKTSNLPVLVVEMKWDKSAEGAIAQIKKRNYPAAIKEFGGEILLVGINYDKDAPAGERKHTCVIEKYQV